MHARGLFLRAVRIPSSALPCLIALIINLPGTPVQIARGQDRPAAAAVEARLRERMAGYWSAMERSDYETAAGFVHPESREVFNHEVPKSRVIKWKIGELRFSPDLTWCDTVTIVTKPIPYHGETIDWPLRNRWVLERGEWYYRISWAKGQNPALDIFRGASGRAVAPSTGATPDAVDPAHDAPPAPKASDRIFPDPANPGRVHTGEKTLLRFHYRNDTSSPMRIVSAHSDCHCTGLSKSFPEIAPGGGGVLEVTLDTFGLPLGRLNKEVAVEFSDSPVPVTVRVAVENLPNFNITPAVVDFGRLASGRPEDRSVKIVNSSGRPVKFIPPPTADPKLAVTLDRVRLEPGETLTVALRYTPARSGEFMDNLLFQTDLAAEPIFTIRVFGHVD